MRFLLSGLYCAIFLPLTAVAQERTEEVVKAAIAASGGEEILAKFPAGRLIGKGTMSFAGSETPFTFEQAYHVPGRFRTVVKCEVKGQKWELIQLVNDADARQMINGRAIPIPDAAMKDLQMAVLLNEIGQLTTLATDRKFGVKLEKQPKGMDLSGLLVQVRGFPEIHLGFDRKNGYLVRCAYKSVDPDTAKEVELETTFEDFKTFSGITRPTRSIVFRDGKKAIDMQVEKYSPLEKIDPKAFTIDE